MPEPAACRATCDPPVIVPAIWRLVPDATLPSDQIRIRNVTGDEIGVDARSSAPLLTETRTGDSAVIQRKHAGWGVARPPGMMLNATDVLSNVIPPSVLLPAN